MQKIELLPHDADHPGERGAHGVGSRHAALLVELIGQPPAHPMRLALDAGDAMTHREQQRAVSQVPGKQPKTVITEIEHDASLGELRRELRPRHDRHRPLVGGLEHGPDRRAQQRLHGAFRHEPVPGGIKDKRIAAAGFFKDGAPGRPVRRGSRKSVLRLLDEPAETLDRRLRQLRAVLDGRRGSRRLDVGNRSTPGKFLSVC